MADIVVFPAEILELIFRNVDGSTFCRLSRVCKRWQCITSSMEKTFWKNACLKEINLSIVEQLIGYHHVQSVSETSPEWKNAYRAWYQGRTIHNTESSFNMFPVTEDNPITCIKVSGAWVLTGHRGGSVYGWNQRTGSMCHVFTQHLVRINDFALVDILQCGPYGFLDHPWNHHHLISVSNDPTVQSNSLLTHGSVLHDELNIVYHHSCSLTTVRVFEKLAAVSCSDNTILVFQMEYVREPLHKLKLTLLRSVIGPSEILWSFGFWHQECQCFCVSGVRKVLPTPDDKKWQSIIPSMISKQKTAFERATVSGAFLLRDKTVFLPTANGSMLVSVDGQNYKKYPLMCTIRTTIVAIALYGSILALGSETGHLFLYHVPKVADLLTLNLAEPAWSSYLSEASIVAVDIFHSENSIIVAASTTNVVYILKWQ